MKSRDRFAIKCFFFSDLGLEARLELMENRLMLCRARDKSFPEKPLPEDFYQVVVSNRHLDVLKSEINWVQQRLVLDINN
ncbi:hypothetical protein NG799_12755 [Laspinema sp. D1]|uniref:Transcriptional regulator n=1 Tax=Laspinema palackyanum D2a TaxID=2953684 RepID=A0ABT2MUW4_9CYAN|nr:hypothetical protein [Laspinema sp. D2b]MCT7967207.1 hypothetical protein [Laspinema sp. D2a]